jgi:hypothetical protein
MHSKTGLNADGFRGEREQRLVRFIKNYLTEVEDGRLDAVLMVARSYESPVVRALIATAAELSAQGLAVRAILGSGCSAARPDSPRSAVDAFVREVRIIRDQRLLDCHEQLVLGERYVWFGDSLRRDPSQLYTHESFSPAGDQVRARRATGMFERLWQLTLPMPSHPNLGVRPPPVLFRHPAARTLRGE